MQNYGGEHRKFKPKLKSCRWFNRASRSLGWLAGRPNTGLRNDKYQFVSSFRQSVLLLS